MPSPREKGFGDNAVIFSLQDNFAGKEIRSVESNGIHKEPLKSLR